MIDLGKFAPENTTLDLGLSQAWGLRNEPRFPSRKIQIRLLLPEGSSSDGCEGRSCQRNEEGLISTAKVYSIATLLAHVADIGS